MQIATDTATLVIYDLEQLRHSIDSGCDWWVDKSSGLKEINQGNVLFVELDEDGIYDVDVDPDQTEHSLTAVTAVLKNTSGRFFVGPGESVTGAMEEPEAGKYGHFVSLPPGYYQVSVMANAHHLTLGFRPVQDFSANSFDDFPALFSQEREFEVAALEPETDIDLVIDRICDHLENSGYKIDMDNEDELIYFHEDYGYVLVEEFEGGVRFATTVAYDVESEQKLITYDEWIAKLLEVLDRFNANASVARAYNNIESNEVVFDAWYPSVYTEQQFDKFLDLWHEDVLNKLEEAQNEVFMPHQTH